MWLATLALQALALSQVLCRGAHALELVARVHYPIKNSPVEHCAFTFQVHVAAASDPSTVIARVPAELSRTEDDLFVASLLLDDQYLYGDVVVAVLASHGGGAVVWGKECGAFCHGVGPQGDVVNSGPYTRTQSLQQWNSIDLWPDFSCRAWASKTVSFASPALGGRRVDAVVRLPGAQQENPLPRPSQLLPAVLFRLNSEWYWGGVGYDQPNTPNADSASDYAVWHSLMVSGAMQSLVVVEVYIDKVDWMSWDTQPIYTTGPFRSQCPQCDPELKFICDRWSSTTWSMYAGGNHSFGSAAAFFEQLYMTVMPQILGSIPERTDSLTYQTKLASLAAASRVADGPAAAGPVAAATAAAALDAEAALEPGSLRVGVWGYCIGGLGAWNAIATRPDLFNMAYLGSPAVDFNCGEPFRGLENISVALAAAGDASEPGTVDVSIPSGKQLRPLIYIDSGAEEGDEMNRQALLLFRRLQERGLVPGRDVFYTRAPFGTHQSRMFLRRALRGLLVLFGSRGPGDEASLAFAVPGLPTSQGNIDELIGGGHYYQPSVQHSLLSDGERGRGWPAWASVRQDSSLASYFAVSVVSFVAGALVVWLARGGARGPLGTAGDPLLRA